MKRKTVFVVDDDASILEVVRIVLEDRGYVVITQNNAIELQKKIATDMPDIILLDLVVPGLDKKTFITQLKANKKFNKIPVIIISALDGLEVIARELNADGFLVKPFSIQDLENIITRFLQ